MLRPQLAEMNLHRAPGVGLSTPGIPPRVLETCEIVIERSAERMGTASEESKGGAILPSGFGKPTHVLIEDAQEVSDRGDVGTFLRPHQASFQPPLGGSIPSSNSEEVRASDFGFEADSCVVASQTPGSAIASLRCLERPHRLFDLAEDEVGVRRSRRPERAQGGSSGLPETSGREKSFRRGDSVGLRNRTAHPGTSFRSCAHPNLGKLSGSCSDQLLVVIESAAHGAAGPEARLHLEEFLVVIHASTQRATPKVRLHSFHLSTLSRCWNYISHGFPVVLNILAQAKT